VYSASLSRVERAEWAARLRRCIGVQLTAQLTAQLTTHCATHWCQRRSIVKGLTCSCWCWPSLCSMGTAGRGGEPNGCLNDAPCSPCTRHGASIKQPFGAGQAGSMMSAGRRMPSHSHTVAHGRSDPVGDALERRLDCLEVRGLARASRGPNALF
jgi:hypothetical protein